jgi:CspA family cold shock protein
MYEGTICSLRLDKGYGFINRPGEDDVFFHRSDLEGLEFDDTLEQRRVRFTLVMTEKGARAKSIRPV